MARTRAGATDAAGKASTSRGRTRATTMKKKTSARGSAKTKAGARRTIRCYLCGASFEVSAKTMSTTCSKCNKAIKVEDLSVKSYVPVNELQTCGNIKVTRRGRIAARMIQAGRGIECEGTMEGSIETDGTVSLGPKATWKGKTLQSQTLAVADGATLIGHVCVPWDRP